MRDRMTFDQEARLPQYAQRELTALRNKIRDLSNTRREQTETRVWIPHFQVADEYLPDNTHLQFRLKTGQVIEVGLDTSRERLTVHTTQGRSLSVHPQAGNWVNLT